MTDTPGPPTAPGDEPEPDPVIAAIPENIRQVQALRGYTDLQMAHAVGVAPSTWARHKAEPRLWTLQRLMRVARVLDVDLQRLTTLTPPGSLRLPAQRGESSARDEVSNGA